MNKQYQQLTNQKLKMLDGLIIFSLLTLVAQIEYAQIFAIETPLTLSWPASSAPSDSLLLLVSKSFREDQPCKANSWKRVDAELCNLNLAIKERPSLGFLLNLNSLVYHLLDNDTNISLASLRVQLSDVTFSGFFNKKVIGEFIIDSFLLYLSCLCLIGLAFSGEPTCVSYMVCVTHLSRYI